MHNFDRFLLAVVYDIPVFVFVADAESGEVVYANPHMQSLRGDACLGRGFLELFPSGGARSHFVSYAQRQLGAPGEVPPQSEYFDDESENWYHVLQRPIAWIDGSVKRVFVLNEINALKAMQKQLSEAHAELAYANRELELAARTDALTRLANRRQLDAVLAQELARSRRSGAPLSLFLLDCDHFKAVNDRYGHAVGDQVLRETAERLRAQVRGTDTLGRWGGEEFMVLLPDTGLAGAGVLAEKLRLAICEREFATVGPRSLSIGVAQWRADESLPQWLERADAALYRAKAGGRNRVEVEP